MPELPRLIFVQRPADWVVYLKGETHKWAPGDSRLGAITELISRYPHLANTPCAACGEAVGSRDVAADLAGHLVHLECL